ncbi:MAG TPA: PilZ domain-containing protein [Sphingomicrobium sp.]|nr:PilZ domain-containing protein [Sphingomicrobium sp.]
MLVSQPLPQLPDPSIGRRERRSVNLHGFAARQDGSTSAVKLTDLSYDGCGLETTAEFTPGERIELSILRRGAIAARVRWCMDGRAGLTFDAVPAAQKRLSRASKRTEVTAEVALRRPGRSSNRVRVLEVSVSGCKLELVDRPDVDEQVWVRFDGLEPIEATVRWIAGVKAGLKYANPIHPAVFDLMVTKLRGGGAGF